MRTNKWLIREFPEDLGIKDAILATQISSLFYFELRTPSLVYTIFEWFSHWSKLRLCLMVRQGSGGLPWVLLQYPLFFHGISSSLSSQTKSSVNDLFFWSTLVALSKWIYDTQNHIFGLPKLHAATWTDIVKRQFIALLSPSGILSRHLSSGLILSKDNLFSCSILRQNSEKPFPLTWRWHRYSLSLYLTI